MQKVTSIFFVYDIEDTTPTVIEGTIKDGTVALIDQIGSHYGWTSKFRKCMYVYMDSKLKFKLDGSHTNYLVTDLPYTYICIRKSKSKPVLTKTRCHSQYCNTSFL